MGDSKRLVSMGLSISPVLPNATLLDCLDTAVWIFDMDHNSVLWANQAALKIWGSPSVGELCARRMGDDMSPGVARRLQQYKAYFIARDARFTEMWTLYPNGVPRALHVQFRGYRLPDGRLTMLCEGRDPDAVKPEAVRSTDALLHTDLMISLHDRTGETLYCNPAARTAFDQYHTNLRSRFVSARDFDNLLDNIQQCGEHRAIAEVNTIKGQRFHDITTRSCYDPVLGVPSLLVSASDVSEFKEAESLAHSLAKHDALTDLPNRLALPDLFEHIKTVHHAQQGPSTHVLYIDLDNFKPVNDAFGHKTGDLLLINVADRLRSACSAQDTIIRLGGDEFMVILMGSEQFRADTLARHLIAELTISVRDGQNVITVAPSIGLASSSDHGMDLGSLMHKADLAMHAAKISGCGQYRVYDDSLNYEREEEIQLLGRLPDAIRNGEIMAFYQPRICAENGTILSVEALARWNHPTLQQILPARFVPLAERSGLIEQLGTSILEQALKQRATWAAEGHEIDVSVNISLRQLSNPDFSACIASTLKQFNSPPECLELELTETLFGGSNQAVLGNLDALRHLGVRIAIDDFGTGYSNMARLNEFGADCIKIDRSLVSMLPHREEIVQLIISMCKLLRVTIVAEGVENDEQARWLRNNGVDQLQGFLLGKAMPGPLMSIMLQGAAR